jgi:hypothetical protein
MAPPRRPARRAAAPSIGPHPSPAERAARGRAARAGVPRSAAGIHEAAADRPDPVELLEHQSATPCLETGEALAARV